MPAVARQELPRGAEKEREAVSCPGMPERSLRGGVETRKPRTAPPRGPQLFATSSVPEMAGNSPSTGVKKADQRGYVSKRKNESRTW